jgi:hypothetical protein
MDQGIAMFEAPFDRDRQLYLTLHSEALLRPGKQRDLDAAASKGIEAIRLVLQGQIVSRPAAMRDGSTSWRDCDQYVSPR